MDFDNFFLEQKEFLRQQMERASDGLDFLQGKWKTLHGPDELTSLDVESNIRELQELEAAIHGMIGNIADNVCTDKSNQHENDVIFPSHQQMLEKVQEVVEDFQDRQLDLDFIVARLTSLPTSR